MTRSPAVIGRPTAIRGPRGPWAIGGLVALVVTAASACGRGEGAPVQELPEGVTAAMVARGDSIYHGPGFCYTCHGADGRGVPNLGADLTDSEWKHTDGSFEGIVSRVTSGVSAEKSTSGVPMPPKGGARLSEEQVRAVAAYVWTLGRGG